MSRTYRVLRPHQKPNAEPPIGRFARRTADGKSQTMSGLDRCPPAVWRTHEVNRPERRELTTITRLAMRLDPLDLPAFGKGKRPYFT